MICKYYTFKFYEILYINCIHYFYFLYINYLNVYILIVEFDMSSVD